MFEGKRAPAPFPSLQANDAAVVVVECADLTLELTTAGRVESVHLSSSIETEQVGDWVGKPLADLVAPDSAVKLDRLLADNSAGSDSERRWRHLNLTTRTGDTIPLLLKYFEFEGASGAVRLVCARDLRPLEAMQGQLQSELIALEQEREALGELLANSQQQ
ncbi:MAG: hypothetical protein AAGH83_09035 [Pseudomonadota bacterium]